MEYNIHPIIVHFPIAMLFLYSIIKILPLARWFPRISWRQIERVLLAVGVVGAFLALATGETAEHLVEPNHDLVEMHSTFATLATWLYAALLLGEIFAMFNAFLSGKGARSPLQKVTMPLERLLCHPFFSRLLALVALVAIALTGLLGGVMVYGVSADPLAPLVLKLLGITL